MKRRLELLAPAKNLECGIAAIDHGADAVYIGAPSFGARASAGNTVDDIRQLCDYAHRFSARVYVTVNTIVYDSELEQVRRLLRHLSDARVDAVLVQDMAVLQMLREPCPAAGAPGSGANGQWIMGFHASTQTDNRTPEKVRWLKSLGFSRVVLARELSAEEIREIHRQVPDVELEVFVHGALCVSYSGLCYASQHCFGRSANRGECAQVCRMKFDLVDSDGTVIERQRHLLSLKDLNQSDHLEALADAGATSFKIEGRLKDLAYVKNVTAAYSERLNALVRRHPERYERASRGCCTYTFRPDLKKTFNRGYTTYFLPCTHADDGRLTGRQAGIASFDTPKAVGEYVGTVKEIRGGSFNVAGTASFANGDGLCFIGANKELEGFRVNRVEGNRLYPQRMPSGLRPGLRLYRNNDIEMERVLSRPSAERKIPVTMSLRPTDDGFALTMDGVTVSMTASHQTAEKPQRDNIVRQLTKLGGTPYVCRDVEMDEAFNYFIPSSQLSELRRRVVDAYMQHTVSHAPKPPLSGTASACAVPSYSRPYLYNIANDEARAFYEKQGLTAVADAFELREPQEALLMQCRHCLRFSLGFCTKNGGQRPRWREPLFLQLANGHRFRLEFDCHHCQMNVYA